MLQRALHGESKHLYRLCAGEVEAIVDDEAGNAPDAYLHRLVVLILYRPIELAGFEARRKVVPIDADAPCKTFQNRQIAEICALLPERLVGGAVELLLQPGRLRIFGCCLCQPGIWRSLVVQLEE